ncbi:MAG: squalene/phytoene synthase family protein [Alphaproteobacteria bacterium]|nr:squalene/phytoene synthase family protein [Alphaproteobacteria bacterium]MBL6939917.1 squalene/phytoene synthase family protein [Alphaproteobacteria bacterium]MBL7099835.1 squalene/phytoene synthase family protein [Alphaproteobacteria bacterium]
MAIADPVAQLVRSADPDRYLSALFAPAGRRPLLHALYAFNIEIARVADTVREPMMGEIRLEWWRETLAGARQGEPRNHDTARALTGLFLDTRLPPEPFEAMLAARTFDSTSEAFADRARVEAYCDATAGNLTRLAMQILGGENETAARHAGIAYALAGILRSLPHHAARHKLMLPLDLLAAVKLTPQEFFHGGHTQKVKAAVSQMALWAREHYDKARAARVPPALLPAVLPASLVPLFLHRVTRRAFDPLTRVPEIPIHRRQVRLLFAATRKRI